MKSTKRRSRSASTSGGTPTGPKYQEVRDLILEEIEAREPGDALPQERELADRYEVSRATLRHALQLLADEGRVYSIRGQGTFVAQQRVSKDPVLTSFTEDMVKRGLEPGSRLLSADEVQAPVRTARALELEPGSPVFRIVRVRLADWLPMCLETLYLPTKLFPDLLREDLEGSLYRLLTVRYRTEIASANQTFTAAVLNTRQADLLGVRRGTPALRVRRVSADTRGRLVEDAESLYRADRYDFQLLVRR
jgi:GntR family transcriptional regulator